MYMIGTYLVLDVLMFYEMSLIFVQRFLFAVSCFRFSNIHRMKSDHLSDPLEKKKRFS